MDLSRYASHPFSSIFILIAYVPNAWGFHWSKDIETFLMTPYSYSMGILAFFVGGTTAKALTDSMNRDLPRPIRLTSYLRC